MLASGIGLRQSSRNLGLSQRCTELKFRKIARHLRRLNQNLRGPLAPGSSFQLDELETYEGRRNTRPLSVPVLIERESRFVVWAEPASIRPRGKMSEARKKAIRQDEKRFGRHTEMPVSVDFKQGTQLFNIHDASLFNKKFLLNYAF